MDQVRTPDQVRTKNEEPSTKNRYSLTLSPIHAVVGAPGA
jgi:hypothetical protein